MTEGAASRAKRGDRMQPDHKPVCPRCGDFCANVDKWSPCCGVWLWIRPPSATEIHLRAMIFGGTPNGYHRSALMREATEATRERGH